MQKLKPIETLTPDDWDLLLNEEIEESGLSLEDTAKAMVAAVKRACEMPDVIMAASAWRDYTDNLPHGASDTEPRFVASQYIAKFYGSQYK